MLCPEQNGGKVTVGQCPQDSLGGAVSEVRRDSFKRGSHLRGQVLRHPAWSINDVPILGSERKYHWVPGRRPDDHPGLSDLGL
jgi:hypothetical protein